MKKLPVDLVVDFQQAIRPTMREQARVILTAAALQGSLAHPSRVSPQGAAALAVHVADQAMALLYPGECDAP